VKEKIRDEEDQKEGEYENQYHRSGGLDIHHQDRYQRDRDYHKGCV
jgi:hypothetical protein